MGSSSGWHFPSPGSADIVYDGYDSDDDHGGGSTGLPHQGIGSLSRLSICTSSMCDDDDVDDGVFVGTRLSIYRCFDSDDDEDQAPGRGGGEMVITSSDSDKDQPGGGGCYSLPVTPLRLRRSGQVVSGAKEYASENEAHVGFARDGGMKKLRRRDGGSGDSNKRSGGRRKEEGLVVITRPKGGQRSLCMDLEEVKACRDLGFELEHERMMMEVPASRLSFSGSNLDTSSGGNSPIANWRISSPGDDPRDVKARLKVWAQAVAIASTSRHGGF